MALVYPVASFLITGSRPARRSSGCRLACIDRRDGQDSAQCSRGKSSSDQTASFSGLGPEDTAPHAHMPAPPLSGGGLHVARRRTCPLDLSCPRASPPDRTAWAPVTPPSDGGHGAVPSCRRPPPASTRRAAVGRRRWRFVSFWLPAGGLPPGTRLPEIPRTHAWRVHGDDDGEADDMPCRCARPRFLSLSASSTYSSSLTVCPCLSAQLSNAPLIAHIPVGNPPRASPKSYATSASLPREHQIHSAQCAASASS